MSYSITGAVRLSAKSFDTTTPAAGTTGRGGGDLVRMARSGVGEMVAGDMGRSIVGLTMTMSQFDESGKAEAAGVASSANCADKVGLRGYHPHEAYCQTNWPRLGGYEMKARNLQAISVSVFVIAVAGPANAGLTICNKTEFIIEGAVAFFVNDPPGVSTGGDMGGSVHGWWHLDPGSCQLVDKNVAKAGQFFYSARTIPKGTNKWDGTSMLCVRNQAFAEKEVFLMSGRICTNGLEPLGFKRVPQTTTVEQTENLVIGD